MRVLVFGNGCREHALAWKVKQSSLCEALFFYPESSSLSLEGLKLDVQEKVDFETLAKVLKKQKIDVLLCGPEAPLAEGLVNQLAEHFPSCKVLGPSKEAAVLESSKSFAKAFMKKASIPTARFELATSFEEIVRLAHEELLRNSGVVLKADGLAGGKGVFVCHTKDEVGEALAYLQKLYKDEPPKVLIEEELKGREFSYFSLVNHRFHTPLGCAVDFKRLHEKDLGPNTGGMGAYTPVPWLPEGWELEIKEKIMDPLLAAMADEGVPYKGILYCGLMLTKEGPKVIEFNVRLGDPEAQALLVNDSRDFLSLFMESCEKSEGYSPYVAPKTKSVGMVLASSDYPYGKQKEESHQSFIPEALFDNKRGPFAFGAAMKREEAGLVPKKGRMITVVGQSQTSFQEAKEAAVEKTAQIKEHWGDFHCRYDIASKVIGEESCEKV